MGIDALRSMFSPAPEGGRGSQRTRETRRAGAARPEGRAAASPAPAVSVPEAARAATAVRPDVVRRVRGNVERGWYATDDAAVRTAAAMLESFSRQ
jgi:hypothetical protein